VPSEQPGSAADHSCRRWPWSEALSACPAKLGQGFAPLACWHPVDSDSLAPLDPAALAFDLLGDRGPGFMVCSKRMQLAAAERLSKQGSGAELSDLVFLAIWFFLQF
jgi:hypothetical protein